jgi:hypothetical protein
MWRIATFAEELFHQLTGKKVEAYIVSEPMQPWGANFQHGSLFGGGYRLCLNYGRLGGRWFARTKIDPTVTDLLLHEFAHLAVSDHLSAQYHKEATRLGAKLAKLVFDNRKLFEE